MMYCMSKKCEYKVTLLLLSPLARDTSSSAESSADACLLVLHLQTRSRSIAGLSANMASSRERT